MSEPGKAMMGTAVAGGPDRANKAADMAVACPLPDGIDLSGARGVLVLIAASKQTFKLGAVARLCGRTAARPLAGLQGPGAA